MFGNPETTTGGKALKFYASLRMDIRRTAGIKGPDNQEIGNRVKVKIVKNKIAPPFRIAEFDILFNEGISRLGSILDMGVDLQIIDKKGTWLSYNSQRLGQGREASREYLKGNPALADEIEKLILQKYLEKGAALTASAKSEEVSKVVDQLSE